LSLRERCTHASDASDDSLARRQASSPLTLPSISSQIGQGMLIGMAIMAVLVIGFVVYIEEKG
jgi:hypothetical protein